MASLTELDGIFALKGEQRTAVKAFLGGKCFLLCSPSVHQESLELWLTGCTGSEISHFERDKLDFHPFALSIYFFFVNGPPLPKHFLEALSQMDK